MAGALESIAYLIDPRLKTINQDAEAFGKSLPRHSDNGPGDAARHAYAASKVAQIYNPLAARLLGHAHEAVTFGQDCRASNMDTYNNSVGSNLKSDNDEQLKELILGLINENKLRTLPANLDMQGNGYAEGGLTRASHSDLYQRRARGDQSVAPQEHRAFAREWTQDNPMLAVPSLLAAIPAYSAAKALGLIHSRTPASLNQVTEGYKGVAEGLGLDKLWQD